MMSSKVDLSKFDWIDFHTHEPDNQPGVFNVISVEAEVAPEKIILGPDNSLYTVGLHPWWLDSDEDIFKRRLELLRKVSARKRVIAFGEVGLDKLKGPGFACQKGFFCSILELAQKRNKPVVVHCVRCYPELMNIKKKLGAQVSMMVHGFNSKPEVLEQLLKHGCYVSLGVVGVRRKDLMGWLRKNSTMLSRICLETDDSATNIKSVYEHAAKALEIPLQQLCQIMHENFFNLFGDKWK